MILTGAASALTPTPANIGYGLSKTAVHYLIASLSLENSGLPNKAKVCGIVPIMLDTVPNRNAMPDADYSSWTPLAHVAQVRTLTLWTDVFATILDACASFAPFQSC